MSNPFITTVLAHAGLHRLELDLAEGKEFIPLHERVTDDDLRFGIYKIDSSIPSSGADALVEMSRAEILRLKERYEVTRP